MSRRGDGPNRRDLVAGREGTVPGTVQKVPTCHKGQKRRVLLVWVDESDPRDHDRTEQDSDSRVRTF